MLGSGSAFSRSLSTVIGILAGILVAQHMITPAVGSGHSELSPRHASDLSSADSGKARPRLMAYDRLSLSFEPNQGQIGSRTRFLAHAPGYTVLLTTDALALAPNRSADVHLSTMKGMAPARPVPLVPAFDLHFDGARPGVQPVGTQPLPGSANYFVGNNPRHWRTNIPTYARVTYRNLYPGISLEISGGNGRLTTRWLVAAGADTGRIRLSMTGGPIPSLDRHGNLPMAGSGGRLSLGSPLAYQAVDGRRQSVPDRYRPEGLRRFSLRLARYDRRAPLVVEPVLRYAIQIGGSSSDFASGIAVDAAHNAYIVGSTSSGDFPAVNAVFPRPPSSGSQEDVFVAKLNAAGTALIYSTYLGGRADETGAAIAVDSAGAAYLTGFTRSTDFPHTGALGGRVKACNRDRLHSGDAFVGELSAGGDRLVYSTCLGGANTDWGSGIAVDAHGSAYVTGTTSSPDFPTRGAFQARLAGQLNAFVAKIGPRGSGLIYSTYLGGTGADQGFGVAVDSSGAAHLAGTTSSADFPLRLPAQPVYGGGDSDAFAARLDPTGHDLTYSTYLGGAATDQAGGVAIDARGNAYVTGATDSSDFPTANAWQNKSGGEGDAFVTELSTGGALLYSTYLGGARKDAARGIAVDAAGDAFVTGGTVSSDFPVRGAIQPVFGGGTFYGDAFAAEVAAGGQSLIFSTYLGGAVEDVGTAIAVDSAGSAYLTGGTSSADFPSSRELTGVRPARGNAFVVRIQQGSLPDPPAPAPAIAIDHVRILHRQGATYRTTTTLHLAERADFVATYHTTESVGAVTTGTLVLRRGGKSLYRVSLHAGPAGLTSLHARYTFRRPDLLGSWTARFVLDAGRASSSRTLKFTVAPAG